MYAIFQFSNKVGLIAGFDLGKEDRSVSGNGTNTWYAPIGILRFTPNDQWAFALRGEYYNDENGVIVSTGTPNGFKTTGLSLNIDYIPIQNAMVRLEVRNFSSKDKIFIDNNIPDKSNTSITFSAAVGF